MRKSLLFVEEEYNLTIQEKILNQKIVNKCVTIAFDINDYSKINAMFGIQNNKYKNWETSTDAYTAEDYAAFLETWNENASK